MSANDRRYLLNIRRIGGAGNMVVPNTDSGYAAYAKARGALAIPRKQLVSIANTDFALHPALAPLAAFKMAVILNIGTLIQPVTKKDIASGAPLPAQRFSHSDQTRQWDLATADDSGGAGWGGRIADYFLPKSKAALPMCIGVDRLSLFANGANAAQYVVGSEGAAIADILTNPRTSAMASALLKSAQAAPEHVRRICAINEAAVKFSAIYNKGTTSGGPVATPFPRDQFKRLSELGRQLFELAHYLRADPFIEPAGSRKVLHALQGGNDSHDTEAGHIPSLNADLAGNLAAFLAEMGAQGNLDRVLVLVTTEFGRSLTGNNGLAAEKSGSDHAWGNNILAFGAVKPGAYGTPAELALGGPMDVSSNGLLIPTTSVDQLAATATRWFGVPDAELPALFPNLKNFAKADLGFAPVTPGA